MQSVGSGGDEVAVGDVHRGAQRLEARGVQVEPARADRVATGDRDVGLTDSGHERTEDRDGRAQGPDELVVGAVSDDLGHLEHDDAGVRVVVHRHPEAAQQLGHDGDVDDRRDVRQGGPPGGEQGHRHQLEGAVLGPDHRDLAAESGTTDDPEPLSHGDDPIRRRDPP